MIHRIYAIFDAAAGVYMPPFHMQRDNQAIRAVQDVVNSKDHPIAQHPHDYTLFHLGSFDDNLGVYLNNDPGPRALTTALALVNKARDADTNHLFPNQGMQ